MCRRSFCLFPDFAVGPTIRFFVFSFPRFYVDGLGYVLNIAWHLSLGFMRGCYFWSGDGV